MSAHPIPQVSLICQSVVEKEYYEECLRSITPFDLEAIFEERSSEGRCALPTCANRRNSSVAKFAVSLSNKTFDHLSPATDFCGVECYRKGEESREWQKRNSQGIEQEMNILFEVCVSIIVIAVISRRIVESLFNRKKESAKLRGKLQVTKNDGTVEDVEPVADQVFMKQSVVEQGDGVKCTSGAPAQKDDLANRVKKAAGSKSSARSYRTKRKPTPITKNTVVSTEQRRSSQSTAMSASKPGEMAGMSINLGNSSSAGCKQETVSQEEERAEATQTHTATFPNNCPLHHCSFEVKENQVTSDQFKPFQMREEIESLSYQHDRISKRDLMGTRTEYTALWTSFTAWFTDDSYEFLRDPIAFFMRDSSIQPPASTVAIPHLTSDGARRDVLVQVAKSTVRHLSSVMKIDFPVLWRYVYRLIRTFNFDRIIPLNHAQFVGASVGLVALVSETDQVMKVKFSTARNAKQLEGICDHHIDLLLSSFKPSTE